MRFSETFNQIEIGIADPRLLDEHLMYSEQVFRNILQQTQSLSDETQWKLRLRFGEAGFTFDQLVEAHVERIIKARNGSYHREKNAANY